MATAAAKKHDENIEEPGTGTVAGKRLKQYIERIERLEEEKKALSADMRDIFTEAKSSGFDVKTMRQVLKLRKLADQERRELDELLNLYMAAIGMD